jgi:hypothetical protein
MTGPYPRDEGQRFREILYQKETQNSNGQCRANNNLAEDTVLLAGTDNLGVHSHEVVVDGVLLLLLGFLYCGRFSLVADYKGQGRG